MAEKCGSRSKLTMQPNSQLVSQFSCAHMSGSSSVTHAHPHTHTVPALQWKTNQQWSKSQRQQCVLRVVSLQWMELMVSSVLCESIKLLGSCSVKSKTVLLERKEKKKNMLLEAPQSQTSHYKCQQENVCCRKRRVGEAVLCFLIWFSGKASLQL